MTKNAVFAPLKIRVFFDGPNYGAKEAKGATIAPSFRVIATFVPVTTIKNEGSAYLNWPQKIASEFPLVTAIFPQVGRF